MNNIAGVILNGGQSSRMGQDKSQLMLNDRTLLQHAHYLFDTSGIKDIFISGQQGIQDLYNNKGPLAGVFSCLNHLERHDYIIFMPVDMPLISSAMIKELKHNAMKQASYFFSYNLPFIIQNSHKIRSLIEQDIKDGNLSIKQLLGLLDTKIIKNTHPKTCFINTNSPQQWEKVLKIYNLQN